MIPKDIAVSNLLLDIHNPRLPGRLATQVEAYEAMLTHDLGKVTRLAEDIVAVGVNPAEALWVMTETPGSKRYVVLEGNRRITALRALRNPESLNGIIPTAKQRRFSTLAQTFAQRPIERMHCVVVQDRAEARHWIRTKHTGERGGAGVVGWNSVEIARFERDNDGKPSPALEVLDVVREYGGLDDETLGKLEVFPLTNLDRILDDSQVRKLLGYDIVKGQLVSSLSPEELLKPFTRMVRDVAKGIVKVDGIKTQRQRVQYVEGFKASEKPDLAKARRKNAVFGAPGSTIVEPAPHAQAPAKRTRPASADRTTVFPKTFAPQPPSTEQRLVDIYHELRDLSVERKKNACSVLFRVFVELSVDAYIARFRLYNKQQTENSSLRDKLSTVANELETRGVMTTAQLLPVRRAQQDGHLLAAGVKTFNQYVHNRHFMPSPSDLRAAGDNFAAFLEALWA